MTAADSPTLSVQTRSAVSRLLMMAGVLGFSAAMMVVLFAPLVLSHFFTSDQDYSRLSDIGQSYGAASAVVSTVALAVVLVSVVMQHRQVKAGKLQAISVMTEELIQLTMENPVYRQCWGARVAPENVPEDLFYCCNKILKTWKLAWDLHDLPAAQARASLANFFDSEIPRCFWERHSVWHLQGGARNRRVQFLTMVNEEYLRALRGGPPSRPREFYPESGRSTGIHRSSVDSSADGRLTP